MSPMNARLLRPRAASGGGDADALAYIAAVEAADGQALENSVRTAYTNFIAGCKTDGIWTLINSCCILCGARTLTGALTPLKSTMPAVVNNSFVGSTDYNRKTGLQGASGKWLNPQIAHNVACAQNDEHCAAWKSNTATAGGFYFGSAVVAAGTSSIYIGSNWRCQSGVAAGTNPSFSNAVGLYGVFRNSSSSAVITQAGVETTDASYNSQTVTSRNMYVMAVSNEFASNQPDFFYNQRLSFFSFGRYIAPATLNSRVSALMTEINAASI